MNCYDSSFVIDYLDGRATAIDYLETHADHPHRLPAIVLFELFQGELYSDGPPQFEPLRHQLGWADVVPYTEETALYTGRLLDELSKYGRALRPRDAMIAGTAYQLDATLVSSDADLTNSDVQSVVDVETY